MNCEKKTRRRQRRRQFEKDKLRRHEEISVKCATDVKAPVWRCQVTV
jgi:hypothetical protein